MIEIKNLCKNYGQLKVYDNFNLDLNEGEITCILGESGSGKTTLLNCVARLTDYKGIIPVLKCAYVFQTPRLVPNLTVGGNLRLVCKNDDLIDSMLKKVNLTEKKNEFPIALSGGQAQRVSLARAFLYGGDIILMDEPFSSLDLKLKAEISKLFKDVLISVNGTALFVTHDVDEAINIAQRIIVIRQGEAALDVRTDENDRSALREKLVSVLIA